jgi:adenine-specific DNA-methyltransferase
MEVQELALDRSKLVVQTTGKFPSTRYRGSKAKLVEWIWEQISDLEFRTCLDAFGGTGSVAYRLKQAGKIVTYNDTLRFNYYIGRALIENCQTQLASQEVEWLLGRHPEIPYPSFIQDNFGDIYFTHDENMWIDQTITNIYRLIDPYKFSLAFFALCQACMIKRPYNLFHRKNLYLRLADVDRSFYNKGTWDKSFDAWFRVFVAEANEAIFDNKHTNTAFNFDANHVPVNYDLVYIDSPYLSREGNDSDYLGTYHFLEGLTMYNEWSKHIDQSSKNLRLKRRPNKWTDKKRIYEAFASLLQKYHRSIIVISYRSDGIPSEEELVSLLKQYKQHVRVEHFGPYQYVLSTNSASKEILLIGT